MPLCQYNIYANPAFSICVNFITHKGLIQSQRGVLKPMTVKVSYSRDTNTAGGRKEREKREESEKDKGRKKDKNAEKNKVSLMEQACIQLGCL